ncbi:helix-turn-helix domain-containing protein [Yinghuangia aomiensis]|uniref:helix-turn-helix domain-containing protein n=1 Tax=Yinghuangia aomiensis TaxID=676205 RepID=UPI003CD05750
MRLPTLGRPAALAPDQAADVVDAYEAGTAVKAVARRYDIAPRTIPRHRRTRPARRDRLVGCGAEAGLTEAGSQAGVFLRAGRELTCGVGMWHS